MICNTSAETLPAAAAAFSFGSATVALILLSAALLVLLILYKRALRAKKKARDLAKETTEQSRAQEEELLAMLNMVEKLNSKLDAQSQALNKSSLVAILKENGAVDYVNKKFSSITGYTLHDLEGKCFSTVIAPDHVELYRQSILPTLKNGHLWRGELCQLRKDNTVFWVEAVFVPMQEDEVLKIYTVEADISLRIEIEQKLIAQNDNLQHLNELKDKLFSIVSHDFRSPLKSLAATLELFKKQALTPGELAQLTTALHEKVENTYNFLENMLTWAKSQMHGLSVKREPINAGEVIAGVAKLLGPQAEKKGQEIRIDTNGEIIAYADLEMIKLVLRNLASNAIKFSGEGGKIIIKAEVRDNEALFSVVDFGTGIDEAHLEDLFLLQHYTTPGTANETGAGLGLVLCKEFIERNHGEIWAESEPGKGSTFRFTLPLATG